MAVRNKTIWPGGTQAGGRAGSARLRTVTAPRPQGGGGIAGPREETMQHLTAFETWYANDRSIRKLSGIVGVPENTLYDWKKRFDWVERANNRDTEAKEIADREAAKEQAQRIKEQREAGTLLRLRGAEYYQNHSVQSGREAVAAIKAGIDVERQADALPDWVIQILHADIEELDAMESAINELLNARAR